MQLHRLEFSKLIHFIFTFPLLGVPVNVLQRQIMTVLGGFHPLDLRTMRFAGIHIALFRNGENCVGFQAKGNHDTWLVSINSFESWLSNGCTH